VRQRTSRIAAIALMGSVLLAGCTSGGPTAGDREAEGTDEQSASAPAGEEPAKGPIFKDSRVCIVNASSKTPSITFRKSDKHDQDGPLAPGAQACAEGGFYSAPDVKGTVAFNSSEKDFFAYSGSGAEYASLWEVTDPDHHLYSYICASSGYGAPGAGYAPGAAWDDGILRYTWAQLPDSKSFIEWTLTLSDTQDPVDTGRHRQCPAATNSPSAQPAPAS